MSSTPEVLNEPRVERFTVASTVAELIASSKQHPLIWMVRDVVQEDGIHILHGAEESFKTMLTLQLHESLTVGKPFLLREVKGGLRTGIAELEMKARPFGSRLGKQGAAREHRLPAPADPLLSSRRRGSGGSPLLD